MARIRLDKLIDTWDPILRKAFLDAIRKVTGQAQIEQITRMIEAGNVDAAMRAIGLDPINFRSFDQALTQAFEAGGNATASGFPLLGAPGGLRVVFQFNIRNPAAEAWIGNYSSTLITEIIDDQRNMARSFLEKGLAAGNNPRTTALDLVGRIDAAGNRSGGFIGLTSSQSQWVQNYADALASDSPTDALAYTLRDKRFDGMVKRAAANDDLLTADQIDNMTTAYRNRALRYRAEAIARTESITALHEAQQQAMEQAVESGAVAQENVSFVWRATQDNRTRDSHVAMDGQEVKMGEMFISGLGNELEYPGDPNGPPEDVVNCRCWRESSIDFYAELT
jgi:Phage Mu protein F like protein